MRKTKFEYFNKARNHCQNCMYVHACYIIVQITYTNYCFRIITCRNSIRKQPYASNRCRYEN